MKRNCPVCNEPYEADSKRLRHGRQTTCSRACSYLFRGQKLAHDVLVTCASCGKQLRRSPAQIKSKHGAAYCSRACHYEGRRRGLTPRIVTRKYHRVRPVNCEAIARAHATRRARNNYGHYEHTKLRLREATARAIAAGRVAPVSQCENDVATILDSLGIGYSRQIALRDPATGRFGACVDFLLTDGRVLEVNGTFWHADPRVFPAGPIHASQHRTASRWQRKVALLQSLKIPLHVVWECDIRENPRQAVEVALARIA